MGTQKQWSLFVIIMLHIAAFVWAIEFSNDPDLRAVAIALLIAAMVFVLIKLIGRIIKNWK